MRILTALSIGLLTGIVFAVAFVYILTWNARRTHPEAIMVAVGLVPTSVAFIIGFGIGVIWEMRR
jgi:hypothetical protein